jgi:hypothetical protein
MFTCLKEWALANYEIRKGRPINDPYTLPVFFVVRRVNGPFYSFPFIEAKYRWDGQEWVEGLPVGIMMAVEGEYAP